MIQKTNKTDKFLRSMLFLSQKTLHTRQEFVDLILDFHRAVKEAMDNLDPIAPEKVKEE